MEGFPCSRQPKQSLRSVDQPENSRPEQRHDWITLTGKDMPEADGLMQPVQAWAALVQHFLSKCSGLLVKFYGDLAFMIESVTYERTQ